VLDVYHADRAVHPYGIYDVANLWHTSTWWVDGPAVVGLLDLPGSPVPVVYAVSASADDTTLRLLAVLASRLPPRFVITGPRGLTDRLAASYAAVWSAPHVKMHLVDSSALPAVPSTVDVLARSDLDALEWLFRVDPQAGTFFHPSLLDTGYYVGVWDGPAAVDHGVQRPELVAVAGVHVVDPRHGVAALGNVSTHPRHRRRGLARATVGALCRRLLADVDVIGLNVRADNVAGRALYRGLGFVEVAVYEEAELVRRA
jgi:ribosomal protein S18 acetylase RimI-like enzyme